MPSLVRIYHGLRSLWGWSNPHWAWKMVLWYFYGAYSQWELVAFDGGLGYGGREGEMEIVQLIMFLFQYNIMTMYKISWEIICSGRAINYKRTFKPSQARLQRGNTLLKLGRLEQAAADYNELVHNVLCCIRIYFTCVHILYRVAVILNHITILL